MDTTFGPGKTVKYGANWKPSRRYGGRAIWCPEGRGNKEGDKQHRFFLTAQWGGAG